jgi:hypothetical protein
MEDPSENQDQKSEIMKTILTLTVPLLIAILAGVCIAIVVSLLNKNKNGVSCNRNKKYVAKMSMPIAIDESLYEKFLSK